MTTPSHSPARSPITTHVLDTALGHPAQGVPVVLEFQCEDGEFEEIGRGVTNADGRITDLLPPSPALGEGIYRISFDTGAYFASSGQAGFYPSVSVLFRVDQSVKHYHVPLLLSPYGYSTYRGS